MISHWHLQFQSNTTGFILLFSKFLILMMVRKSGFSVFLILLFFLIHLWVCNLIPYCCTLFSPVQKFTLPCSSSNTLHQVTLHRCIFQPALTLTPSPGLVPSLPHCGHSPHPPLDLKTYFEPPLLRDICVTWLQKKNYIAGLRLLSFEEATCQVGS